MNEQIDENMQAQLAGRAWPHVDYVYAGLRFDELITLERAALERLRQDANAGSLQRGLDQAAQMGRVIRETQIPARFPQIPRIPFPDTPAWMLALLPNDEPLGQQNDQDEVICVICRDKLPARVSIARPCGHRFCVECLDGWISHLEVHVGDDNHVGQRPRCPICQRGIRMVGNNGDLAHRVWAALGGR